MHNAPVRAMMTFHHILSSRKIDTLHAWATELRVLGLMKTGYPGILVLADRVPTNETQVHEYVRRVKRLPWQTCELRAMEAVPGAVGSKNVGAVASVNAFADALSSVSSGSASRRSGLAEFERIKDISPVLRAADMALAREQRPDGGWEEFYTAQLFQSDDAIAAGAARAAKAKRTAKGGEFGYPIWPGGGAVPLEGPAEEKSTDTQVKLLSAALCSWSTTLWTGTSSGSLLCFDIEQGKLLHRVQVHKAPVSALAACSVGQQTLLFSGSWDRAMHIWLADRDGARVVASISDAAGDFIKAICVCVEHNVVFTGGSDKAVRMWDLSAVFEWLKSGASGDAPVPSLAAVLSFHTRPVTAIAVPSKPPGPTRPDAGVGEFDVFTADSMGRVVQSRISDGRGTPVRELDGNETAINDMRVVWRAVDASDALVDAGIDYEWVPDVWTASADKHARRFPLAPSAREGTERGRSSAAGTFLGNEQPIRADRVLQHPHAVSAVVTLGESVVTACDGDMWTWKNGPITVEGHSHEATFLDVWLRHGEPWVVSAGLDGSVRRWPQNILDGGRAPAEQASEPETAQSGSMLTAEEEAELAELMDDE
ncbi:hypothetical protein MCUN1_001030 [Malassezia cuniculi]|uniref:Uncharacterized protein n=1 Tax=Malassezia cuniculi TaxID=948313 RepID=A0AAF0EWY7_9BASI|nr:hypothetical protein MCUN1_001030 [Malassezia cuniculi]